MIRKIEAVLQIVLLIVTSFAISYFIDSEFKPLQNVAAQSTSSVTQEQIDEFKEAFPELDDQQIREMINSFGSVEGARTAREEIDKDVNNAAENGEVSDNLINFLKFFNNLIPNFGGNSQMQSLFGEDRKVYTCPLDKENSICQRYKSSECAEACQTDCIEIDVSENPLPSDNECAIGICYDPEEGTCEDGQNGGGSPQGKCEEFEGEWYAFGNPEADNLCRVGCCNLGEESKLLTQRGCENLAENLGVSLDEEGIGFNPEITNEYACLQQASKPLEGACVVPNLEEEKNDCKFASYDECIELTGDPKSFYVNTLCSHPELNTSCQRLNSTNCVEGKDGVYWFDSCGNRENIYSVDEVKSWNGGVVLPESESCPIGDANNPVAYQAVCGNCNSVQGTICGNKTEQTDNTPKQEIPGQNVVCRDMGCYQKDILGNLGRIREHGESWCAYNSQIGVFGPDLAGVPISLLPQNPLSGILGGDHAADTPGSRHFRVYCQNGEITTSQCDDFRNSICVEQRVPKGVNSDIVNPDLINQDISQFFAQLVSNAQTGDLFGGTFSKATCRPNRWQECFAYNPDQNEARLVGIAGKVGGRLLEAKLALTCGRDPDCFVKTVDMTSKDEDTFKFSMCAPRYPPGSDLSGEVENSGAMCNFGSKVCTSVWVKEESGPFGAAVGAVEWKCKSNCDCVEGDDPDSAKASQKFIQEMNNVCISMGDCGSHVNYMGTQGGSKGYDVRVASCDVEKDRCEGGGFGGLDIGSLGFGGANSHPEDALALPGDFIPADGDFIAGIIGESGEAFFGDILEGIPGIDQLTSAIDNLEAADGTPNTDYGMEVGEGAGIGLLGGASGSIYSAVGRSAGGSGTSLAAAAHNPSTSGVATSDGGKVIEVVIDDGTPEGIHISGSDIPVPPAVGSAGLKAVDASVTGWSPLAGPHFTEVYVATPPADLAAAGAQPIIITPTDPAYVAASNAYYGEGGFVGPPLEGSALPTTPSGPLSLPSSNSLGLHPGTTLETRMLDPASGQFYQVGPDGNYVPYEGTPTSGTQPAPTSGGEASSGWSPQITGADVAGFGAGIVAGAAAGAALSYILDVTGVGAGLNPVTSFTLTAGTSFVAGSSANAAVTVALKDADLVLAPSPIGIAVLAFVAYTVIMGKILGVGEMKKVEVSFTCQPWEAPTGGNCEACGQDAMSDGQTTFPCSRYSCQALEQNCVFVEDSEKEDVGGVCIPSSNGDVSAPVLVDKSDEELSEGFEYYDLSDAPDSISAGEGFKVKKDNGECIDQFERVNFGFKLDEFATCRYSAISPGDLKSQLDLTGVDPALSADDVIFQAMPQISGGISKEHKLSFNSRDLFESLGRTEPLLNERNDVTLFIACEDYQGANNVNNPFEVKLCINKRDLTAVQFLDSGELSSVLEYNADKVDLNIKVTEAAQCKWDRENFDFENEGNDFNGDCKEVNGEFVCTAIDISVNPGENEICVKCKDHPELAGERESERNVNAECLWTSVERSSSELKITRISPGSGSSMIRGAVPVDVVLETETSGGLNGNAKCKYEIDSSGKDFFESTGNAIHKQPVKLLGGVHKVEVECTDEAGNRAKDSSTFTIFIDNIAPTAILRNVESGIIRVSSNEKSLCAYTNGPVDERQSACEFHVEEAGDIEGVYEMSANNEGLDHTTSVGVGKTYYIKCKDEFNNQPLGCSISGFRVS